MYTPHRGPNIPCKWYKGMLAWSPSWLPTEGTYNLLVSSSGTIGYASSPTRYYATPNELCKYTDYVWVSVNTGYLETEHANWECNN